MNNGLDELYSGERIILNTNDLINDNNIIDNPQLHASGYNTIIRHIQIYNFVISKINELFNINNYLNILDIGCGCGYGSYKLANKFKFAHVIGADINIQAIKYAKSEFKLNNLTYQICELPDNIETYESNNKNIITCIETIEHMKLEQADKTIYNFNKILKQNGILFLTCPINESPQELTLYHQHNYSPNEIISLINKHLDVIQYFEQQPNNEFTEQSDINNGNILIIAKKRINK